MELLECVSSNPILRFLYVRTIYFLARNPSRLHSKAFSGYIILSTLAGLAFGTAFFLVDAAGRKGRKGESGPRVMGALIIQERVRERESARTHNEGQKLE
jgi:hypothetical protein